MNGTPARLAATWLAAISASAVLAQAPTPQFRCGSESLTEVGATLDVAGTCSFTGKSAAGTVHMLRLQFAEFAFPPTGDCRLGESGVALQLDGKPQSGSIHILAFGCGRVALRADVQPTGAAADPVTLQCDAVPALAPVAIAGAQNPTGFPDLVARPDPEDVVFAALGNTGSGLPGQRRIGKTLAALAPTGPLDFVLLLGDSFLPAGVTGCNDPKWQTCFQQPYPEFELPVPFHVVPGPRDLRGDVPALASYGESNWRWQMPALVGDFELHSHGKDLICIGFDSTRYFGPESDPATGQTRRALISRAARSQAVWKIVFGNAPLYAQPGEPEDATRGQLRETLRDCLENAGVELYIAAGGRYLEVQQPEHGPLQVCSGGGGGREVAASAQWGKDTMFAATGGGFFWFRYDGVKWEISARDSAGKVLFVHQLYPR